VRLRRLVGKSGGRAAALQKKEERGHLPLHLLEGAADAKGVGVFAEGGDAESDVLVEGDA